MEEINKGNCSEFQNGGSADNMLATHANELGSEPLTPNIFTCNIRFIVDTIPGSETCARATHLQYVCTPE